MATPGELSSAVARLVGRSEPTVLVHDRNLAAAGFRTRTGGRGRSAAKMTSADAAAVLVTALASPSLRDSVETFQNYAEIFCQRGRLEISDEKKEFRLVEVVSPTWDLRFMPIPSLQRLDEGHTFIEALTSLMAATASGELILARHNDEKIHSMFLSQRGPAPGIRVKVTAPDPSAQIILERGVFKESHVYWIFHPDRSKQPPVRKQPVRNTDCQVEYTVTDRTIYGLAKLLSGGTI